MEKIIYEAAQLFIKTLSEHSANIADVLSDPENEEIVDECIEIVIDEILKTFDEYVSDLESSDDD